MARVPSARATSTRPFTWLQLGEKTETVGVTQIHKTNTFLQFTQSLTELLTVTYTRLSTESLSLMEWRHFFQFPTAEWT